MKHWVFVVLAAAVLTACDPWDEATKNNKQTPADLGIQYN